MGDSIWEKHVDNYFWSYATQLLASVILIGTIIQLSRESLDFLSDILKCITGFYFCCVRLFLFLFFTETKQMNCWHWFQHIFPVWLFSSVTHSCLTLCDPMDCSMPGFPVYHQLLELAQTHVNGVSDTIQPSHPLLSPSPPAFNCSQNQGLFHWVSSSHQVAKVLELQL